MPKYCSVPNCNNDSGNGGDRKSFYKFPLGEPVRLQQWLRNMGREDWTPARHQYVCHRHFAPPCFRLRWGVRHLEPDAVPTLFLEAQKRKAVDDFQEKPKRLRTGGSPGVALDAAVAMAPGALPVLPLYQLQADGPRLVEGGPPGPAEAGGGQPVSLETAAVTWEGPVQETQVIAYFETIPNVFPCEGAGPAAVSPETVLSAALSSQPISSTLPIVSQHTPPPPPQPQPTALALGDEGEEGDEGDEGLSEAEDAEEAEHQLDEHCYHRSSRSREQLEALVAALQRKLQLLQQRHQKHRDRMLLLEGTLGRLTQSSLLTQERLQLLERAFVQAGVAAAGVAGETVAIIYEQDSTAFLYTPLPGAQTAL